MQEQKFKVGDKVVRTHPSSKLVVGETYIIKEILSVIPAIILEGYSNMYNLDNFELAEIDDSVFDTPEILTPLQAAEALINGDDLEVITSNKGDWKPLLKYPNSLTIKQLKYWKFRHKPKTIVINGVEVPAPLSDPRNFDEVWGLVLSPLKVYSVQGKCSSEEVYYWSNKEDAHRVLDAMLIPFNELNKSNKGEK